MARRPGRLTSATSIPVSDPEVRAEADAPRAFVLADCHGWPELIVNALRDIRSRYGGVREGVDRLVFAGDFLDRGPRAQECLDLIEALAGEVLWGNHDLAVTVGYEIRDQGPESRRLQLELRERLAHVRAGGGPQWKLVTEAGGVLISHAGVSSDYQTDLDACGGDLAEFCRRLSEEHAEAVALEIRSGDWKSARTRGKRSPTRYKLEKYGAEGLLPGVVQVIGHTPPEKLARGHDVAESVALSPREVGGDALTRRSAGPYPLYLVDPSVQWSLAGDGAGAERAAHAARYAGPPPPGRYRYAVIRGGRVSVHESGTHEGAAADR